VPVFPLHDALPIFLLYFCTLAAIIREHAVMSVDYTYVEHEQIHRERARQILKAHPEVRTLMGPNPWTALFITLIVAAQLFMGAYLQDKAWWLILIVAYIFGAF